MTSRVQKGGPIFKPIAKSRVRATSSAPRQASTPVESHGSSAPTADVSTPTTASMPPPSSVPVRGLDADTPRLLDPPQPVASSSRVAPVVIASCSRLPAPPTIVTSSQPPILNYATRIRSSPVPPVITSRAVPVPVVPPASLNMLTHPPHISDAPDPHLQTSQTPPPLQQEVHFPEEMSQLVQQTNASILVLNSDSVVKKKTRKKKKADTSIGDTIEGGTSDNPAKKAKRKRVKNDAGETSEAVQAKPKKRRKKVPKADDTAGEESDSPVLKKRKKASQPVLDPDADPGEEIDPTVVTMSELCTDTGQGRISRKAAEIQRNHLAWKQQSKERRARMKALAEQKKYGRPDEAEGIDGASVNVEVTATAATDANVAEVVGTVADDEAAPAIADATGSGFDYSQDLTASRFTVQVRIGPNGETIIDEESLTVDRTEEVDTTNYVHVVESDNTKFVNSASYTRKCRGSRWSEEETEMFFDALAQHGENYELISLVLPGRNRTACKNKFKAEDRKDSAKVTRYLESRRPIDIQTLGRVTGKDFSGPVPVIRMPTPPPMPDPATQQGVEKSVVVKKRSRSRTLPSTDGVEIIGDAETYDTGNFLDSE